MGENDPNRKPKTFVLCFDGTGNKFSGTDADSNILKIYRMLNRNEIHSFYQPGIGTYITSGTLDHTSIAARIGSWYAKAKDSAVGTSFADHVMDGYKFLMRYYSPGDDLYFLGFSRGAYTARYVHLDSKPHFQRLTLCSRFLAEMLDHVGLLSAGNEELARFAWKTFSKWQSRRGGGGSGNRKEEKDLYEFMTNFRDTFSRPVKRIRFLGLFDTVNSVPRFESAWMQRSKFPYTARSSAKVIRHAVAINERRAKFRQDLITGAKLSDEGRHHHFWKHRKNHRDGTAAGADPPEQSQKIIFSVPQLSHSTAEPEDMVPEITVDPASPLLHCPVRPPLKSQDSHQSRSSLAQPVMTKSLEDLRGRAFSVAGPVMTRSVEDLRDHSQVSHRSHIADHKRQFSRNNQKQDIEELWFPGSHADIGGGWPRRDGEAWPLSHAPLVWMVHEAEKAGLRFDPFKMAKLNCCPESINDYDDDDNHDDNNNNNEAPSAAKQHHFHNAILSSGSHGFMHDCLEFGGGLAASSVLSWKLMEYLPFRRMDLRPDGSWKPIRWPLPAGETRDIPDDARIHHTAIRRMREDASYRPGNLIVGGGGRGLKRAPASLGIGEWKVVSYEGDPVREAYVRVRPVNGHVG
jgi:uncharacterized protein (DUF2235 family)